MRAALKVVAIAAVAMAEPRLSCRADADTIRVETLVAMDLSESEGFDRIRIEYIVDGGKMQAVRRNMRHGDQWDVQLDITFDREVTIQLYEKEKWIKKDKKLGAFTLRAGEFADGSAQVFNLTGHGARYWMSVGRGSYTAPEPPQIAPKPAPDHWLDGGTFSTPDAASEAGSQFVATGVAKKYRVYPIVDLGTYRRLWEMRYVAN